MLGLHSQLVLSDLLSALSPDFLEPFSAAQDKELGFYTHSGPGVWELGMVNAKCMGNSGAYEKGPSVQTDLTHFKNEVKMVTPEVVRSLP